MPEPSRSRVIPVIAGVLLNIVAIAFYAYIVNPPGSPTLPPEVSGPRFDGYTILGLVGLLMSPVTWILFICGYIPVKQWQERRWSKWQELQIEMARLGIDGRFTPLSTDPKRAEDPREGSK